MPYTATPVPSPATENLRDRILMAARECFARKGFDLTGLSDIQEAAGVSRGGIYHHFPNKEAIIEAITRDNLGRMAGKVAEILDAARAQHLNLHEAIEHLCSFVQQIVFGPGQAMGLRVWAAASTDATIRAPMVEAFERIRGLMCELIKDCQRRGEIAAEADASQLATVLFSVTIPGFQVQRIFLGDQSVDPQAYAKGLAALLAGPHTTSRATAAMG